MPKMLVRIFIMCWLASGMSRALADDAATNAALIEACRDQTVKARNLPSEEYKQFLLDQFPNDQELELIFGEYFFDAVIVNRAMMAGLIKDWEEQYDQHRRFAEQCGEFQSAKPSKWQAPSLRYLKQEGIIGESIQVEAVDLKFAKSGIVSSPMAWTGERWVILPDISERLREQERRARFEPEPAPLPEKIPDAIQGRWRIEKGNFRLLIEITGDQFYGGGIQEGAAKLHFAGTVDNWHDALIWNFNMDLSNFVRNEGIRGPDISRILKLNPEEEMLLEETSGEQTHWLEASDSQYNQAFKDLEVLTQATQIENQQ